MKPIRVAVVDDSTFMRKAILRMLADETGIEVVGSAGSGEELLANVDEWQPDVVTLDLNMPGIGGLATLDRLMARRPTPVIILSTHSGEGAPLTIEALHRGAIDFIDKQRYSLVDFETLRGVLLSRIFQVTEALRHKQAQQAGSTEPNRLSGASLQVEGTSRQDKHPPDPTQTGRPDRRRSTAQSGAYDVIVIGASTGGPPTVERVRQTLGPSISVPIVVVQHMPVGFTQAFAERLNAYLPLQVSEVIDAETLLPDTVYIAPSGLHLRLRSGHSEMVATLSSHPNDVSHVPSIDVLFHSAAKVAGRRAIGVLLTGMGRDGARGLLALREAGAYTLAQDETTSIVYGMPRAALEMTAVIEMGSPEAISHRLKTLITASTT